MHQRNDIYIVPFVREDFNDKKWCAVAKILYKGWKEAKYFPVKLAPAFLENCMFGETHSDLIENFLKFLCVSEGNLLKTALNNFDSVEGDELIDILDSLKCKRLPSRDNIALILKDIAHKEFIQRPKFIIDCWKQVLFEKLNQSDLGKIFSQCIPTPNCQMN